MKALGRDNLYDITPARRDIIFATQIQVYHVAKKQSYHCGKDCSTIFEYYLFSIIDLLLLNFTWTTHVSVDLFFSYFFAWGIYSLVVMLWFAIALTALEDMPIAVETDKAKSQHYELPTLFFKLVLGENLKYRLMMSPIYSFCIYIWLFIFLYGTVWSFYFGEFSNPFSCCYFKNITSTLEDAENAMLELYSERAQLKDGQKILDVGCGWGSFVIYIAKKYKNCSITGICNSSTQKTHIEEQCRYIVFLSFWFVLMQPERIVLSVC